MTKDKKYLDPATNVQDDIDAPRHCERSEAIQKRQQMDRHALLAMDRRAALLCSR